MWFERDLQHQLGRPSLPVRILVGPRQCGKSALIARLKPDATWLSLDDIQIRLRAQDDPLLLLETSGGGRRTPVVLDEAAHAPNLFSEVKRQIDLARRRGEAEPEFWITGSNRLLLDREVRESLAGRASYFFLHTLGVSELGMAATLSDWLFRGGFPELYVRRDLDVPRYMEDYVRTFVEKDIAVTAGVEKLHEFHRTLRLLAARTGTLLDATEIGRLAGVKGQTVSGWLDLLDQNALAHRLEPYHANLSKRVVRSPKVYFLDAGFAAHLQGWRAVEPLLVSPQAGLLFETLVFGELVRARDHRGLSIAISFWRTKEGEEIDFLIEFKVGSRSRWLAVEAKMSIQQTRPVPIPTSLSRELADLQQVWIVTPGGDSLQLSDSCRQIPIADLAAQLETFTSLP
jgi:predicted AAA+ superfamily ATPase